MMLIRRENQDISVTFVTMEQRTTRLYITTCTAMNESSSDALIVGLNELQGGSFISFIIISRKWYNCFNFEHAGLAVYPHHILLNASNALAASRLDKTLFSHSPLLYMNIFPSKMFVKYLKSLKKLIIDM